MFTDQHLLRRDEIHLTKLHKAMFKNRMDDLIKRAFM